MENKKDVSYLGKDFGQFRRNLVEFAKQYFPNTYTDFNQSSPGSLFIDMAAYVGDVLSYYADNNLKESLLEQATERGNIYDIAKALQQRASVLLEMGDIEQAEATYHQSLGWDAYNEMTITKLKQIQESRETNLHTIDRSLTPTLTNLEGNQPYQSFLERNYLKEAQNLQSPGCAHIDKMKNRGDFFGILSFCVLSAIVIVALFS